jgi:hypothetical protein
MCPDIPLDFHELLSGRQTDTQPGRFSIPRFRKALSAPADAVLYSRKSGSSPILFAALNYRDAFKIAHKLASGYT